MDIFSWFSKFRRKRTEKNRAAAEAGAAQLIHDSDFDYRIKEIAQNAAALLETTPLPVDQSKLQAAIEGLFVAFVHERSPTRFNIAIAASRLQRLLTCVLRRSAQ